MKPLADTSRLVFGLSLGALLSAPAIPAAPAAGLQPATPDTARLRQALAQAFGDDFEIVRDELSDGTPERGGTFWLVHASPRRSGDFTLTYRYAYVDAWRPEDPLYTHVQHESSIAVGEQGCWRAREHKIMCLGDTIILPFVVNNFTDHTFTLVARPPSADTAVALPPSGLAGAGSLAVAKPASAHLAYLRTSTHDMPHRNGGNTRVYMAHFQALAPGRLNLALQARSSEPSPPSPQGSVPVIVVARGTPVTVLLMNESVIGSDEHQGFSSHSGNQYLTTLRLLQPGDELSIPYMTVISMADPVREGGARSLGGPEPVVPVISELPFHLDPSERFNAWIVGELLAQVVP